MSVLREPIAPIVQAFFEQYLVAERNLRANTVLSYRDALKLFLRYAAETLNCSPDELNLTDLDAELIRGFLAWLESARGCTPRSRNHRLAVLKTFFRYLASISPQHLERCRQIRELPTKRHDLPPIEFLEQSEINNLLSAIDPGTPLGRRNQALLLLLYNTGARVQEVVNLDVRDIRLAPTPLVRLRGKGRKERACPLWSKTADALRRWLESRACAGESDPVFLNRQGLRLSRSGIAYLLKRSAERIGPGALLRARRVTPHVIRHTTAMHLLQAKVDLATIASWLGHAQLSTTHGYVEIDLRMREEALAAVATPQLAHGTYPPPDVVAWLEAIGKGDRYVHPPGGEPSAAGSQAGSST